MRDNTRQKIGLLSILAVTIVVIVILVMVIMNSRRTSIYLIPESYRGWVQIVYNQSGYPEIDKSLTKETFPVGKDGVLRTSTPKVSEGIAEDQYYWINDQGERTPLDTQTFIHGNGVRGESSSEQNEHNKIEAQEFFVGSRDEYQRAAYPPLTPTKSMNK